MYKADLTVRHHCGVTRIDREYLFRYNEHTISAIGKEGAIMATSTFEKNFVITDPTAKKKLLDLMKSDAPVKKIDKPSLADMERGEQLLSRYCSRLKA